jgi:3-hydroxyacyl-CoA dehydrogenase
MGRRKDVQKVVILGANGAMGAGTGQVFAQAGIPTVLLARTRDKAQAGLAKAVKRAKNEALAENIAVGSYDADLERELIDADLILECVAEDLAIKRELFARVDAHRPESSVVATVSSGLSIAALCADRSETFRRHFVGIHFFNPPHVITGCELVPHADTDPEITGDLAVFLHRQLHRELIVTADTPAFCGNRIGFKVLNECAQLAEEYGPAYIDALVGPHTGRAMAPLATVDFVGWDVHQAIVVNLRLNTRDEAHEAFSIPAYMEQLIRAGHLGDKTAAKGGFFRRTGEGKGAPRLALDPKKGEYVLPEGRIPEVARQMTELHVAGRHVDAFDVFAEANGETGLLRKVVLGYVSYALSRVGEVVERTEDVDRIMAHGFRWAPPGLLVDLIGAARTIRLLEAAQLPVPAVIVTAADENQPLYDPAEEISRYFPAPVAAK